MVGDPADGIIADYYAFGARDFDTTTALADMVKQASTTNNDRPGLNYLNSPGYMPHDGSYGCCNFYGPVATTLEYNTADFALSAMAGALGDTGNQKTYANRAQDWRNVLNPASGFVEPRNANGSWTGGFDPTSGTDMVEADSWIYTGMIPFNIGGLARQGRQHGDEPLPGHRAAQLHGRPGVRVGRQRTQHRTAVGVRLHRAALQDPGHRTGHPAADLGEHSRRAGRRTTTTSAR